MPNREQGTKPAGDHRVVLSENQIKALVLLVEDGPILPPNSMYQRSFDDLVMLEMAAPVVFKRKLGCRAATFKGSTVYRKLFGGETIEEACMNRIKKAMITSPSTFLVATDEVAGTKPPM